MRQESIPQSECPVSAAKQHLPVATAGPSLLQPLIHNRSTPKRSYFVVEIAGERHTLPWLIISSSSRCGWYNNWTHLVLLTKHFWR